MTTVDPLKATLLDLLYELRDADLPLLLGGGYGLYWKQEEALRSGARLLLEAVPPARATNDLDVFLYTDVLADSGRLRPLGEALDRLGFTVVPSAQRYQFARKFPLGGRSWDIKVDLLARPPDRALFPHVKVDARRVKPHPSVGVHAHRTDEAIAIEDAARPLSLTGLRTTGEIWTGVVYLPSTYSLLMMKLFALGDQVENSARGFGRKHAIDLYTLVAILTEPEYKTTRILSQRYRASREGVVAARLVSSLFGNPNAQGALRVREYGTLPSSADMDEFLALLHEFFPL